MNLTTEQQCGSGGVECVACGDGAICEQGACVSCPPHHVVQLHQCQDDDLDFDVVLPGATRWPPPPFDGGITVWHPGPADEVTVAVVARSPGANLNGTGLSQVQVPALLTFGQTKFQVEIRSPSHRVARREVTVIATRAITNGPAGPCYLTRDAQVDCSGVRTDRGVFVGTGSGGACALGVDGSAWCFSGGEWTRRFASVPEIIDITVPCVRTRDQSVICERDGGLLAMEGSWIALECRNKACCGLDPYGAAWCWGSHEYDLFDPYNPNQPQLPFYPMPRAVSGLPGVYDRLTSGEKTFFGEASSGAWSSATNRMGFPGSAPFVIAEATASTLKLDSPYYCVMGLENDGGLWTNEYARTGHAVQRPLDGGGTAFIDFAPSNGPAQFHVLNAEHEVFDFTCPL